MLSNKIRVLIQGANRSGKKPWKILLSKGLRWALEEELRDKGTYVKRDQGHFFEGLLIVIDNTVKEPILLIDRTPGPRLENPKGDKLVHAYI